MRDAVALITISRPEKLEADFEKHPIQPERAASRCQPDMNPVEVTPLPPAGFEPVRIGGAYATHNGPLFGRWHEGRLQLGFRVAAQHANPGQGCHGGMLSTLVDILLSSAAQYQADIPRQFLPTISLQTDHLAIAPMGSWVQGQADILKVTRSLIFSQGLVHADGVTVLRASGVFRRGPLLPDTASDHGLRLPGMPSSAA